MAASRTTRHRRPIGHQTRGNPSSWIFIESRVLIQSTMVLFDEFGHHITQELTPSSCVIIRCLDEGRNGISCGQNGRVGHGNSNPP